MLNYCNTLVNRRLTSLTDVAPSRGLTMMTPPRKWDAEHMDETSATTTSTAVLGIASMQVVLRKRSKITKTPVRCWRSIKVGLSNCLLRWVCMEAGTKSKVSAAARCFYRNRANYLYGMHGWENLSTKLEKIEWQKNVCFVSYWS